MADCSKKGKSTKFRLMLPSELAMNEHHKKLFSEQDKSTLKPPADLKIEFPRQRPDTDKRKDLEELKKTFVESRYKIKCEAVKGKFSLKQFKMFVQESEILKAHEYPELDHIDFIKRIFDILLHVWKIKAYNGTSYIDEMENYKRASAIISSPIRHDKITNILKMTYLAKIKYGQSRRKTMTDEEYNALLKDVANEYIHLFKLKQLLGSISSLQIKVENLASTAKFARTASERPDNFELCRELVLELMDRLEDYKYVAKDLKEIGVIDCLSTGDSIIIRELRKNCVPPDEIEFLMRCGFENPESLLTLLLALAKNSTYLMKKPEQILDNGEKIIEEVIDLFKIKKNPNNHLKQKKIEQETFKKIEPRKKRKIWNSIAKIIGGAGIGGSNIIGAFATPGMPLGALVASGATAIMLIGNGIGDYKGE